MLSAQEVFDTVATHLLVQGKPAHDHNNECRYRAPDGAKCAVGCLINDDEYKAQMESWNVDHLHSKGLLPFRLVEHKWLLSDLQVAHDGWSYDEDVGGYNLGDISMSLRCVAKRNDLNTHVLEE